MPRLSVEYQEFLLVFGHISCQHILHLFLVFLLLNLTRNLFAGDKYRGTAGKKSSFLEISVRLILQKWTNSEISQSLLNRLQNKPNLHGKKKMTNSCCFLSAIFAVSDRFQRFNPLVPDVN